MTFSRFRWVVTNGWIALGAMQYWNTSIYIYINKYWALQHSWKPSFASQYIYKLFFQRDLDSVTSVWNNHRIRPSKNENVPHGRPSLLYLMPEIYSTRNYIQAVDQRDVDICKSECHFRTGPTCDPEIFELLVLYMAHNGLSPPTNAQEGIELYLNLRSLCFDDLFQWTSLLHS